KERITQLLRAEQKATGEGREAEARGYAARREQFEADGFRTLEDLYGDARKGIYLPLPDEVSTSLRSIVAKAMAPEPTERYENAREYVDDLSRWVKGGTVQALAETDATAAAVDATKRALQRNLPRAVGVLVALVLGLLVGRAAFKQDPTRPDFRASDIQRAVDALGRTAQDVVQREQTGQIDVLTTRVAWEQIQDQLRLLRARLDVVDAAQRGPAEAALAAFEARVAPRTLALDDPSVWRLVDLTGSSPDTTKNVETLAPGTYLLRRKDEPYVSLPLHIAFPLRDPGAADRPLEPTLPAADPGMPVGMAWLPMPATDGAPAALLVARRLVTCEQYGEFLDDIPAAKRPERLPPKGFHQGDPNDSTRWLAKAEFQDRPVTGLDPEDIAAYVTWRSEAYGVAYRLLTDAEWQRAAGAELLDLPGATHVFPVLKQSYQKEPSRISPRGISIRRTVRGYGEVVQGEAGTLVVKGDDTTKPWLPSASAFRRSVPYQPGESTEYGFRLCLDLGE
ncbi:MAG: SUMF1/EgtB/PvdO family nonheme iron enzyme, partial [Planctomycetota bacterium]|nr:SUMF1/EgtB/PvdO family nonheme iron enzyme [Planctomycetota bacterium]